MPHLHRRAWLQGAAALALLPRPAPGAAQAAASAASVTGREQPALAVFDALMQRFIIEQQLPGAQLAITHERRLVHARGYGLAERVPARAVQPTDLFRIASISKPFTAVAVLQAVERGRIALDAPLLAQLPLPAPRDARWHRITVRQLLQHRAGWDRERSFDPMFAASRVMQALQLDGMPTARDIITFMLRQPLDFEPGERYAYSNFGYCLLGRLLEHLGGERYEVSVRRDVLSPLGIRRMRLGQTALEGRAPGEVRYYAERNPLGRPISGLTHDAVPLPYGAWSLEAMDSHGGWLASAVDLVRFAAAFDDPAHCPLLKPASIATMFARPDGAADSGPVHYACGWRVRRLAQPGQINTWHTGMLDGSSTLLVRRHDGLDWAVLFNGQYTPDGRPAAVKIDRLLHEAAGQVRQWPADDQFDACL